MNLRKKVIILILIIFISIYLIIYFIIIPAIRDIKEISDSIYAERLDLETKYQKGQLLKKTIGDFEKIKPQKEKLTAAFLIEGKELAFVTALEQISDNYGLNQNLSLQKNQEENEAKDFYYRLPLEINLAGNFINILKYFEDLERIDYYFNISTISIKNENGIAAIKLIGEVYVKKPSPEEETI